MKNNRKNRRLLAIRVKNATGIKMSRANCDRLARSRAGRFILRRKKSLFDYRWRRSTAPVEVNFLDHLPKPAPGVFVEYKDFNHATGMLSFTMKTNPILFTHVDLSNLSV